MFMVVGAFSFSDKQRSGRRCLVSGSDGRIFCSTEVFNKEMFRKFKGTGAHVSWDFLVRNPSAGSVHPRVWVRWAGRGAPVGSVRPGVWVRRAGRGARVGSVRPGVWVRRAGRGAHVGSVCPGVWVRWAERRTHISTVGLVPVVAQVGL